jgi:hypothetical protein
MSPTGAPPLALRILSPLLPPLAIFAARVASRFPLHKLVDLKSLRLSDCLRRHSPHIRGDERVLHAERPETASFAQILGVG